MWRAIDGKSPNWEEWRQSLYYASSYLDKEGVISQAADIAINELSRKRNSRPSPERLSVSRTVFVLSLVVERMSKYPRDKALPAIAEQINHPRGFLASEQRWLEQLMGTFYLPEEYLRENKRVVSLQQNLPREIPRNKKVFVAKGAWEDLLWPVQAGINDYWGSPKALKHPIIKNSWLEQKKDIAILSSLLRSARQRDPSARRYFFIHPLDYSLQNGWQALLIDEVFGVTPWYFPMERSFLVALAKTARLNKEECILFLNDLDLGYTSLELSRMSGIGLDALIDIYQNNYKEIAKRHLPAKDSLDVSRLEGNWLRYLS